MDNGFGYLHVCEDISSCSISRNAYFCGCMYGIDCMDIYVSISDICSIYTECIVCGCMYGIVC